MRNDTRQLVHELSAGTAGQKYTYGGRRKPPTTVRLLLSQRFDSNRNY